MEATALLRSLQDAVPGARLESAPSVDLQTTVYVSREDLLMVAQAQLVRALIAALSEEPYRAPLVRWGLSLHDRFLLPTWIWRDFEDVLEFLARHLSP